MGDPKEGLTAHGTIRTGADRNNIGPAYVALLEAAVASILDQTPTASVYVYGSAATGQAKPPQSDVDLLTVGLSGEAAARVNAELSVRYKELCRGVEISAAMPRDFEGDHDAAYGNRVFLRHYCVHLAGPDHDVSTADFFGDRQAARGFNGDIGQHVARWRQALGADDAPVLANRVARKILLAVAGLVSVHDTTWTTDREIAVRRWSQIDPGQADHLTQLLDWVVHAPVVTVDQLAVVFDSTIDPLVTAFEDNIGLWESSR